MQATVTAIEGRLIHLAAGSQRGVLAYADEKQATLAARLHVGDELDVFIAWGKKPVVNSAELVPAKVIRVAASLERHQAVAVQFAGEQQVALVA